MDMPPPFVCAAPASLLKQRDDVMLSVFYRLLGLEQVIMAMPSHRRTLGAEWASRVRTDKWGTRYARAHDSSWLMLNDDGTTGDTALYGTRWSPLAPPPPRA